MLYHLAGAGTACQSPTWRGITNTPRHFLQNFEPPTTFYKRGVRYASPPLVILLLVEHLDGPTWNIRGSGCEGYETR
jgi:hypothetical protein